MQSLQKFIELKRLSLNKNEQKKRTELRLSKSMDHSLNELLGIWNQDDDEFNICSDSKPISDCIPTQDKKDKQQLKDDNFFKSNILNASDKRKLQQPFVNIKVFKVNGKTNR